MSLYEIVGVIMALLVFFTHLKKRKEESIEPKENIPMEVVEIEPKKPKKFEFRPETWEQFIGQEKAKEWAKLAISRIKKGIKTHIMVDGIRGHGKSSLCLLIAKYLDAELFEYIGKQVDEDTLPEIVQKINSVPIDKQAVLFIDETDTMDGKVFKIFNPMIEQFKLNGEHIRPFVFMGATINKHKIIDNNPDTLDRISTHIKLERYASSEIGSIVKQYHKQLYSEHKISKEVIEKISKNCKYNPRMSTSLLEDFIVIQDIDRILEIRNIIKDGLTDIDITILEVLNSSRKKDGEPKPLGANTLALKSKIGAKEFQVEFEPYLLEYDYLNKVPSRIITEKGEKLLGEIGGKVYDRV